MRNLYYKIWVDGIIKLRSIPANKGLWQFYAMTFISIAMALNLILVMTIFEKYILKHTFYNIDFNFFSEKKLNSFLSFFFLYMLLPILVNYLLIFRNKRYVKLIEKYEFYDGKLCVTYLMTSYLLPFVLLILAYILGIG